MRPLTLLVLATVTVAPGALGLPAAAALPGDTAQNLVSPGCWQPFAPRPVNAPASAKTIEGGDARLALSSGGKPFVYGGWRCRVEGLDGGAWYHVRALALPVDVVSLRESLTVLVRWKGTFGSEVAPSYLWDHRAVGDGQARVLFERRVQAPPGTRAAEIELVLQWSRTGRVTWQEVSLTPAAPPAPRRARVAAVWFRPRGAKSGAESVAQVAAFADRAAAESKPDFVLLGEMINHAGAPGSLDEHAEAIPGPTTERLAALARKHSAYFAFSLVERSGNDLFNSGVLIDRQGNSAGKYRKVQLPFEEVSAGAAAGDALPVFSTEFGKVGIMICHDTSFPEPARELAMGGAELILVPIWGGRAPLVRARAIENGVYLATSGYDYDSEVVDPLGNVVASAPRDKGPSVAVADIDFNKTFREDWIGSWRDTVSKQRRDAPYTRKHP